MMTTLQRPGFACIAPLPCGFAICQTPGAKVGRKAQKLTSEEAT